MKGMDMLVNSLLSSLDDNTKKAIEQIPQNVATVAASLKSMDERLARIEAAGTCARLEAIELAVVQIQGTLDGHTIRLEAIQRGLCLAPGYTPDDPLPTLNRNFQEG
jgi:hypothetical protein